MSRNGDHESGRDRKRPCRDVAPVLVAALVTLLPCGQRGALAAEASPDTAATAGASEVSGTTPSPDQDGPSPRDWALAVGAVAIARLADGGIDDRVVRKDYPRRTRALRHVGDAAPFIGFGLAGLQWLAEDRRAPASSSPHRAALLAGIEAAALGELTKLVVNRARPDAGLGPASSAPGSRADSSFPSIHASLAWAVATPYALHYRSDWPYAAASLTNLSRMLGRKHWLSDTVAGAIAGHWIGRSQHGAGTWRGGAGRVSVLVAPGQLWLIATM